MGEDTWVADELERLLAQLSDEDWRSRVFACEWLERMGDRRAVDPLIERLSDPDAQVRLAAVRALRSLGDRRAVQALIGRLSDTDYDVRVEAVKTLGTLGDAQAIAPLIALMGSREGWRLVRGHERVEDVRRHLGSEEYLIFGARHPDELPKLIAEALKQLGERRVGHALYEALYGYGFPKWGWRDLVVLAQEGDLRAVPSLVSMLASYEGRRRRAAAALVALGGQAVPALVAALASALRRRCRQENPWTGAGRKGRHQGCLEALAVLQSIVSAVPGELRGGDSDEVRALREGLPVWRTALGLFSGVPGSIKRPLRELVQVTERVLREREGTDRQGRK